MVMVKQKVGRGRAPRLVLVLVFLGLVVAGCAHWPIFPGRHRPGLRGRFRQNEMNEPSVSSSAAVDAFSALCGDVCLQTVALATFPAD